MKPVILMVLLAGYVVLLSTTYHFIHNYATLETFWLQDKDVAGFEVLLFSPTLKFGTREITVLHFCLSTILYYVKILLRLYSILMNVNEKDINRHFRFFITNNLRRKISVNKVLIGRLYVIYICLNKQPLLPP